MRLFRLRHVCVLLACLGAAGCTAPAAHAQLPLVQTGPLTFAPLVRRVVPAVVNIAVRMNVTDSTAAAAMPPELKGTPFEKTFRDKLKARHEQMIGAGSGFVLDPSGIIVTNNHVVGNADKILVSFTDGTELPAHIIGSDELTDIAVIKVDSDHELPAVQWGDSHAVQVGDWVLAAGNPFGLGGSVTAGIVSARGRDIGAGPFDDFFQLDAPINPGNSGGPSFNMAGQVIALNTAIVSPTGGSVGIGFAIPSDQVNRVVLQLENGGKVVRGYLGVAAQVVSPQMAAAMGLPTSDPTSDGALIAAISPNSPAYRAGLKPGDVITGVNNATVTNPSDLAADIANVDPGHDTSIKYIRNGKPESLSVAVATMPANPDAAFQQGGSSQPPAAVPGNAGLGLTLAPLSPDIRSQLNLPADASGAVVAQVKPNSAADQAGVQAGDLLVGVGPTDITGPDDAVNAINAAKKSGSPAVALRIIRQGQALFVGVNLNGASNNQG